MGSGSMGLRILRGIIGCLRGICGMLGRRSGELGLGVGEGGWGVKLQSSFGYSWSEQAFGVQEFSLPEHLWKSLTHENESAGKWSGCWWSQRRLSLLIRASP